MAWFMALMLLVCATAEAQTKRKAPAKKATVPVQAADTAPTAWPIEQIVVEGNKLYTADQVIKASGLKIGQVADKQTFDAARDKLIATGVFDSTGYGFEPTAGGKGYKVTLQVSEIGQLYTYRFEELPATPEQLTAWLKQVDPLFGSKIPGTEAALQRYARALEDYLSRNGKKEKVIGRLTSENPGELLILFRPNTPIPTVAQVNFTGNSVIQTSALQNTIAGVAVGVPYNERRFRQLLDTSIRPLYDARGRLRVAFPKLTAGRAADVDGLVIGVEVTEGESYQLGEVTIEGAPNDLLKTGDFKPGDVVNFDEINLGVERIRRRIRANGFMQVHSDLKRAINDEKKTVDVTVVIEPGPQYVFGRLNIEGLDLHSEPVIRKLWGLKEGQPFNNEYPDIFLNKVREQGVFDNLGKTSAKVQVNEQSRTVDVTLNFTGAPPPPKPERQIPQASAPQWPFSLLSYLDG